MDVIPLLETNLLYKNNFKIQINFRRIGLDADNYFISAFGFLGKLGQHKKNINRPGRHEKLQIDEIVGRREEEKV